MQLSAVTTTVDPIATAITVHKGADSTWRKAHDCCFELVAAVDPDLETDDAGIVRTAFDNHHGANAEAEFNVFVLAREASEQAAAAEEAAFERLEDLAALAPRTRAQVMAWLDYMKEHAARTAEDGAVEAVYLYRALDQLAALIPEKLAA